MSIYPYALERGIPIDVFWDSSVLEIQDMIDAAENVRKEDVKMEIVTQFAQADAIATRVAYFFSDSKKRKDSDIVQPWDWFPVLFEDAKDRVERAQEEKELAEYKANLKAFASRHNRRSNDGTDDSI